MLLYLILSISKTNHRYYCSYIIQNLPVCFRICLVRSFEYTDENWQPVKEQVNTVFLLLFPFTSLTTVCKTSPFLELFTVVTYFFDVELTVSLFDFLKVLRRVVSEQSLLAISPLLFALCIAEVCFFHFSVISISPFLNCIWKAD